MNVVLPVPRAPSRVLRVGVTGHIALEPTQLEALAETVRSVLEGLRRAVVEAPAGLGLDAQAPPRLALVSPLAAGADQLVAEEALALGYELHAPVPFLVSDVERDFEGDPGSLASFRRLLGRASRVLELGAERAEKGSTTRARGYETVGWVVLSQSDLLLAIWDGQPARGRGGTAEVVALALEAGMPVIEIAPATPRVARLCVLEPDGAVCHLALESVATVVQRLIAPLGPVGSAAPPADAVPIPASAPAVARQRAAYEDFLAEQAPGGGSRLHQLGSRYLLGLWRLFLERVAGVPRPAATVTTETPSATGLAAHGRWASVQADQYQGHYRGAFLSLYLLGAVAVSLALLGLFGHAVGFPGGWGVLLAVLELLSLGLIVLIYRRARQGRWHERGTNYRVLAELLRHQIQLASLGLAAPAPRPRAHLSGQADLTLTWMVAHFRAVAREQTLTTACFDARQLDLARQALVGPWLRGQVSYHERVGAAFERAAQRLETWVFWIFIGAASACALHFLLPHGIGPLLSFLAAGLPAWGAAFHGILGSADLPRLAARSHAMAERLKHVADSLAAVPREELSWRSLAEASRSACADMLSELDDWQALARHRDLRLP